MIKHPQKSFHFSNFLGIYIVFGIIGVLICGYGYAAVSTDLLISGQATVARDNKKLLYAPMDGVGYIGSSSNSSYYDKVNGKRFIVHGEPEDVHYSTEEVKFGKKSCYFAGGTYQRLYNGEMTNLNLGTRDFTVSLWAYVEPHGYQNTMLFGADYGKDAAFELFIKESGDDSVTSLLLGNWEVHSWTRILMVNKAPIYGEWVHYAMVRSNGIITVYENGQQVARTANYRTSPIDMSELAIGGFSDLNTTYKGYIDDFAIYDYAKYTTSGFAVPSGPQTDANLLYIDFEDMSSTVRGPILEEVSGELFSVVGGAYLEGRSDQYKFGGSSLYFPGHIDQRIKLYVPSLNLGTSDFTVSFWSYQEAHDYLNTSAFGADNTDFDAFQFFLKESEDDGMMSLLIGGERFLYIPKTPTLNQWVHYAVVRKNGIFMIYQNGQLMAQTGEEYNDLLINMSDFAIGGHDDINTTYKGYIDDFVIYDWAVYDSNFTPPAKPASET